MVCAVDVGAAIKPLPTGAGLELYIEDILKTLAKAPGLGLGLRFRVRVRVRVSIPV